MTHVCMTFQAGFILCLCVCVCVTWSMYCIGVCLSMFLMAREKQLSNMIHLWVGELKAFPFFTCKQFESDFSHTDTYLRINCAEPQTLIAFLHTHTHTHTHTPIIQFNRCNPSKFKHINPCSKNGRVYQTSKGKLLKYFSGALPR